MYLGEVRLFMKRLSSGHLLLLLLFIVTFQTGFSRGRSARVYMCTETLHRFQREAGHAVDALTPWYKSDGLRSRKVAAKLERHMAKEMMPRDRQVWSAWATARLTETQHHIDALQVEGYAYSAGIESISRVATQLVEFHGFAARGNARKMVLTLNQVLIDHEKAINQVCAQLQNETEEALPKD